MNREDYIAKAPTFTIYDGFCKTKSVLEKSQQNHSLRIWRIGQR